MPLPQNDARRLALVKGASRAKIKALVNLGACTGCEVCVAVCPVPSCIEKFGDDPSTFGVYVNYDICIGCQLCAKDCPWDTIRMVPTSSVAGHQTSLDSQPNAEHPVFKRLDLLPKDVKTPAVIEGHLPASLKPTMSPPPSAASPG
ncbi:MAG: 4Fe-4S dicluster domain-containing protein [Elusimicrobia bacterium]|nr:4Fe-4S dicluster domain-containing protein [Elusimicrobiota bacterium]